MRKPRITKHGYVILILVWTVGLGMALLPLLKLRELLQRS